jgi:hypothetical protein
MLLAFSYNGINLLLLGLIDQKRNILIDLTLESFVQALIIDLRRYDLVSGVKLCFDDA